MKMREDVLDSLYNLTETQKMNIDAISNQLLSIKDQKISIDTFNLLTNCFREIDGMRESIMIRLLASMKRGDFLG
jgi:hypothetical protein